MEQSDLIKWVPAINAFVTVMIIAVCSFFIYKTLVNNKNIDITKLKSYDDIVKHFGEPYLIEHETDGNFTAKWKTWENSAHNNSALWLEHEIHFNAKRKVRKRFQK